MASIFNSLHIGYSGLSVSQVGIETTAHNISNAESEGYTRQRVVAAAATPLTTSFGQVGNGAQITEIKRVFDNFVYDRYTAVSSDKEYSDYEQKTLETLSTYFPEIDGVGVKSDLQNFYNMWQTFADNPDNTAVKVALAQQTQSLTSHITQNQDQVLSLQSQINEELALSINEVNSLAKELAGINKSIDAAESGGIYTANDLRDKKNVIEQSLAKLIGAKAVTAQVGNGASGTITQSYTVSVNGFNIVDGASYHPITISKENNPFGFYNISYVRQDGTSIPMEEKLNGGKIGAMLDLRGGAINTTSGMPTDGIIQKTASELDAFAKGLIESINNLYSSSSTTKMTSNPLSIDPLNSLMNSSLNIKEGSFDIVLYDLDGKVSAKRTINIDQATVMNGVAGSNSIQGQIQAQADDNNDGNANNDIDDSLKFNWATYANGDKAFELTLDPVAQSKGYTFSLIDVQKDDSLASGTNFAGAVGLNRFFDGDSARNMRLNNKLLDNPTLISAGSTPLGGDNTIALNVIQHQFEKFDFDIGSITYNTTTYGMFDTTVTEVGSATNAAILRNETISTQFNATQMEYNSVSKVSIDEEMTNLIKYQTAYGAAAKIITTIDQMMQTLLGIKQ